MPDEVFVITKPHRNEVTSRESYRLFPETRTVDGEIYLVQRFVGMPYYDVFRLRKDLPDRFEVEVVDTSKDPTKYSRVRATLEQMYAGQVDFFTLGKSLPTVNRDSIIFLISEFQQSNSHGITFDALCKKSGAPREQVRDVLETLILKNITIERERGRNVEYEINPSYKRDMEESEKRN